MATVHGSKIRYRQRECYTRNLPQARRTEKPPREPTSSNLHKTILPARILQNNYPDGEQVPWQVEGETHAKQRGAKSRATFIA